MSDHENERERALTAELGALRAALQVVRAPDSAEAALRAAARMRRAAAPASLTAAARVFAPDAAPVLRSRWRAARAPLALAAAAALAAVTALVALRVDRGDVPRHAAAAPPPPAAVVQPEANGSAGSFQPLAYAPSLSPSQSYSVVRVRIPLAAFAPGGAATPGASIEADLLVGEDGLATGIRFDRADTLFVSTNRD